MGCIFASEVTAEMAKGRSLLLSQYSLPKIISRGSYAPL